MKNTIITIISLVVLLAVIAFGYELIFNKPIIEAPKTEQNEDAYLPAVEVKEQYKDGAYTFVGTVQVPSTCHTLASRANTIAEGKYQIEVVTVAPEAGVVCAQVVTDKSYKVSFQGPEVIEVTALINGVSYDVNRFVVPADQNIDTFQLEIKG